ncbi:hypothetical protein Q8791_27230 [Nocardiopsis sp. CT-R113]|uniref:Helix-turn-helix domain-containing protein n=1 Tax=Nocardiopsis codii TaxID=3065942 RepID=A0ABU7KG66_9ACTN|nr:hypothetical protein [Nocardiopsis sp. CT-R113]MEE2040919.1 hypothetical protein [Nocardiopsis sp. CT-R113]
MSSTTPRVSTRKTYKIHFSPYMWVRKVPLATPLLHVVLEALATAVDPDGCYSWLNYDSLSLRSRGASESAVRTSVRTMEQAGLLRRITGQERFDILDAHGVRYTRDKPPLLVEILIPASAYSAEDLARVNRMRTDRGRPPITAESRPDITKTAGERKERKDAGKAAPQRRTKKDRAEEAVAKEPLPPIPEEEPDLDLPLDMDFEDAPDVSQAPDADSQDGSHRFLKPAASGLRNRRPPVSETGNPRSPYPSDADPDSSPSVGAQPQGGTSQFRGPDGPDGEGSTQRDDDQDVNGADGDAARPAQAPTPDSAPVTEEPPAEVPAPQVPPTAAELLVDQLLSETARLGAVPLGDPVEDRRRLVAMAQAALDGGMTPMRLREITSVGLHNVQRQWALATRLSIPERFSREHQGAFGGTPMGGGTAAPRPRCPWHPNCTTLDARGRCAECAEAERMRALAAGEVIEYSLGTDGVWRDHTGAQASEDDEFKGLSEAEIAQMMADRARMSAELASRPDRVHAAAAAARRLLQGPATDELVDA